MNEFHREVHHHLARFNRRVVWFMVCQLIFNVVILVRWLI